MGIMSFIAKLMFERPAQKKGVEDYVQSLGANQQTIMKRLQSAEENEKNKNQLAHIIGIERWSQERLKVGLGETPKQDEYDLYRPATDGDWQTLVGAFEETRRETIQLTEQLVGQDVNQKVAHNQFGELSIKGWLHYIDGHANVEAKRIR